MTKLELIFIPLKKEMEEGRIRTYSVTRIGKETIVKIYTHEEGKGYRLHDSEVEELYNKALKDLSEKYNLPIISLEELLKEILC